MAIGRSIVRLGIGSGLAQIGQLLFIPILGRAFSPAAYGVYVLFVGFAAVAAVFAGLRYDAAIVLPRRNLMAGALAALVLLMSAAFASVVLVGAAVTGALLSGPHREDWVAFGLGLAITMPLQALQRIYAAWLARSGKFGVSGALQFCVVMGTILVQLCLHFDGQGDVPALIYGSVLALAFALAIFSPYVRDELRKTCRLIGRPRRVILAAHRYQRFPRFTILYGLSSALRERVIQMEFGGFASLQALGQFAMGVRLVGSPNTLLYAGVGPVFYAHASKVPRQQVANDAAAIFELILAVLAPIYMVVAVNADQLVSALLSSTWNGTAVYVAILCLPYLVQTSTSWFDRVFDVYSNQKLALMLDALFTGTLAVTVFCGLYLGGPVVGAVCYGLISGLYCSLWMFVAYRANGLEARLLMRPAVVGVSFMAGSALLALALREHFSLVQQLLLDATIYAAVLGIYVYRFGGARRIGALFR